MLKKTTLAVIGLAASGFASAGSMGPVCAPGNVTVPCDAQRWNLGVQALYLNTAHDAARAYRVIPVQNFTERNDNWDWGYKIEGAYFYGTGNDITMNWTHFSSNELNQSGFVGATPIPPNPKVYSIIDRTRFDQVNLVMGQHTDFSMQQKMRFYGGLQYAHIQNYATNYYPGPYALPTVASVERNDNTNYKGTGPVVGVDYSYFITEGLSLTANGAGSILYGNGRYNIAFVALPANGVIPGTGIYATKKSIVPSLEGKLGLNYSYGMAQGGVLNIEGGYQAMNYFNALHAQSLQAGPVVDTNFGLYGPYLGLNYVGNV